MSQIVSFREEARRLRDVYLPATPIRIPATFGHRARLHALSDDAKSVYEALCSMLPMDVPDSGKIWTTVNIAYEWDIISASSVHGCRVAPRMTELRKKGFIKRNSKRRGADYYWVYPWIEEDRRGETA